MEHTRDDFGDTYEELPFEARHRTLRRVVAALVLMLGAAGFMFVALGNVVWAHDAMPTAAQPEGWTYPISCCSTFDCRDVDDSAVIEGPDGYTIVATGEVIPMTSKKVRNSPDGRFHWCSVAGKADGKTICLFAPPRAY